MPIFYGDGSIKVMPPRKRHGPMGQKKKNKWEEEEEEEEESAHEETAATTTSLTDEESALTIRRRLGCNIHPLPHFAADGSSSVSAWLRGPACGVRLHSRFVKATQQRGAALDLAGEALYGWGMRHAPHTRDTAPSTGCDGYRRSGHRHTSECHM